MRTVTVSLNTVWQPSEGKLLAKLRDNILPGVMQIFSIERTLFSNRYAITIKSAFPDSGVYDLIFNVLKNLDYEPDLLMIEEGVESSRAGGLSGAIESTANTVKAPLMSIMVVVVVLGAIYFLPKDTFKSKGA